MALDLTSPLGFVLAVEGFYAGLMRTGESGLGGQLLYAGELDAEGRALLVAANVAGAASLTATADAAAQKQAIRDGVVDFLVTSLEEALRILKNEIRKRETVAVSVALAAETVEQAMQQRGVLPDLLRPKTSAEAHFLAQGAALVEPAAFHESEVLLTWSVASAPAHWLPKLDAIAAATLPSEAPFARNWLRQSPRYLGRLAQGTHLVRCSRDSALQLQTLLHESGAPVEVNRIDPPTGVSDPPRMKW